MPEITQAEIQKTFDEAVGVLADLQADHKKLKEVDAQSEEKFKKMNQDICDSLETVEKLKAKQEAIETQNKRLEELFCNNQKYGGGASEFEKKRQDAENQFSLYLRDGSDMDEKAVDFTLDAMMVGKFKGVNETQRKLARESLKSQIKTGKDDKGYWLANELKDLQVGVDPDGGYFVQTERLAERIDRQFETSPVRQFASTVNTNTESVEHIITDQKFPSGGWVAETESRPKTGTAQIGKLTIHTHEQFAQPAATQKMLDDAGFDIVGWLQGEVNDEFTRVENTAFVIGDGAKKPRGFLDYPAWAAAGVYERGKIEQIETASSNLIEGDDVKKLKRSLLQFYQPNAGFFMNRETFGIIERLKDGEERYLLDTNSLKVGDTEILLGKRVVFMDDIPSDITVDNQLVVVYGDLRKCYEVVDRIGIRTIRDNLTDKPNTLFYTTKRVGGDVKNYQGLKILRIKP